jgi:hypothetical protein
VDRADIVVAVRGVIVANLQEPIEEAPHYKNMSTWVVPFDLSPQTYNNGALPVFALGERKSYVSFFIMAMHFVPGLSRWFDDAWKATGCPLDRGRVAIRMRNLDDVPLDVIAQTVRRVSVDDMLAGYHEAMSR